MTSPTPFLGGARHIMQASAAPHLVDSADGSEISGDVVEPSAVTTTDCIRWGGYINEDGYGKVGRCSYAHRVEWEKVHGPIPPKMQIDHLCRNRACVNVNHLEVVTNRVNMLRGMAPAAVTFRTNICQRGHHLVAGNVYVNNRKTGDRTCAECKRMLIRERKRTDGAYRERIALLARANYVKRRNAVKGVA